MLGVIRYESNYRFYSRRQAAFTGKNANINLSPHGNYGAGSNDTRLLLIPGIRFSLGIAFGLTTEIKWLDNFTLIILFPNTLSHLIKHHCLFIFPFK